MAVFIGFVIIGPLIGFFVALPFYEGSFFALAEELQAVQPSAAAKTPIMVMQGCATFIGLVLIPIFTMKTMAHEPFRALLPKPQAITILLTALAVVAFIVPNSLVIEWNANLDFKGAFWDWARNLENRGLVLTKMLTAMDTPGAFLFVMLIIGILPAIGEEIVFRGWMQPALHRLSGNVHVAIWVSAIAFSALHMQFFGFVPRVLLGAVFGYLMAWSGNLWLPMVAHFANNGLMVLAMYLNQLGLVEIDPESTEAAPLSVALPMVAIFVAIMFYLRKSLTALGKPAL